MRERLEQRAAKNSRAVSAEVVEAIENHLLAADRVTQLWELFAKHKENIETIPMILEAVRQIEDDLYILHGEVSEVRGEDRIGSAPGVVSEWLLKKRDDA